MEERRTYAVPIVAGILLLLATLYVGSYLALVKTHTVVQVSRGVVFPGTVPHYGPLHSRWTVLLYSPLYAIDRQLRPARWKAAVSNGEYIELLDR